MTTRRRPLLAAVTALALLAALALAACTSADPQPSPTPSPSPTAEATQAPAPPPTPTPTPLPDTTNATVLLPGLRVRTAPGALDLGRLPEGQRLTVLGRYTSRSEPGPAWLGVVGLGWVRYDPNNLALDRPLDTLPEIGSFDPRPAAPLHPDDTRTAIPAIDHVIDAVLTIDTDTLAALVQIDEQPCSNTSDSGIPWTCPEGVALGTPVARFDIFACAGDRGPASQLPLYVDALFDPNHQGYGPTPTSELTSLHLYAVVLGNPIVGGYLAYFTYSPGGASRALAITEEGQISRIGYGCGDPVGYSVSADPPPILRPYAPPILTAPFEVTAPPPTGIPGVDAIFRAFALHDADALVAMVQLTEVECTSDSRPGYDARCSDLGLNPGDTYRGISVGNCDVGLLSEDRIPQFFAGLVRPESTTPYGAYLPRTDPYLDGAAVVMLANPDDELIRSVQRIQLLGGRIVSVTGSSCSDLIPPPSEVARWLIHPTDLGYDLPVDRPPVLDDLGRFFGALTSAGLEAVPAPETFTLPWLTSDGTALEGGRLRIGETAAAALFDLRDEATRTAVRNLVQQALPDPLIAGPRAIWVTDQVLIVLWNQPAYPAIEQIITSTLGEPLLLEPVE